MDGEEYVDSILKPVETTEVLGQSGDMVPLQGSQCCCGQNRWEEAAALDPTGRGGGKWVNWGFILVEHHLYPLPAQTWGMKKSEWRRLLA